MSEIEKIAVGGLVTVLVLFTPGFLLHQAPRFPGSLAGSLLGITGAILMVLLLVYPLVKRCAWLRSHVTAYLPMHALLSFHIYAGALGAVLGLLHTGHKFASPLGITLVIAMLATTLSGFIGRYYFAHVSATLHEQKVAIDQLRAEYEGLVAQSAAISVPGRLFRPWRMAFAGDVTNRRLIAVITAIADTEYGMRQREGIHRALGGWMVIHIAAAAVMYAVLALHIWNGLYFGLRWL